jgi:trimeric autotransporter adhesin
MTMRTTALRRRVVLGACLLGALALAPGALGAKSLSVAITASVDSNSCASYGAHGVVGWSGDKVDKVVVELGANSGGAVGTIYSGPKAITIAPAKTKGQISYSFSNVAVVPGTDVAIVAKFFFKGVEYGTLAFTDLGTCVSPDLVVQTISLTAPANYPPHSYTVTVKNQGTGSANLGGVSVQGYYSPTTGTWPTNDPACGSSFNPGTTLAPGATIDIPVGCSAAPPTGDGYLVVKVDSGGIVAESDETNNIGSFAFPDLTVQNIAFTGTANNYTVTVKNQGPGTADLSGISVQGYYSADSTTWPTSDSACGNSFNSGTTLAAGATVDITVSCSLSPSTSDKYLVVKADSGEILTEADETNNIGSTALPAPDLVVQSISLIRPAGYPVHSYTVTVKNQGTGPANIGGSGVQGYYSATAGTWPTSHAACGTSWNAGTMLAAGATIDITVGCEAGAASGDNYLVVKVDDANIVNESNENNNIGSVALPDLTVQNIVFTGNAHDYTVTISNGGIGTADLSGVGVQGYYGTDSTTWPTNHAACGNSFNNGMTLAPGTTVDITVGCSLAPQIGDLYLVVKADSGDILTESDETNNVGSTLLPLP